MSGSKCRRNRTEHGGVAAVFSRTLHLPPPLQTPLTRSISAKMGLDWEYFVLNPSSGIDLVPMDDGSYEVVFIVRRLVSRHLMPMLSICHSLGKTYASTEHLQRHVPWSQCFLYQRSHSPTSDKARMLESRRSQR